MYSFFAEEIGAHLNDYANWLRLPHEKVQSIRSGAVYKLFIKNSTYYLKLYTYPTYKDIWKILFRGGLFGRTRAQMEYKNLEYLNAKGLSPKPLFLCQNRKYFLLRDSFIVMEEVPNAIRMDHFLFDKWHTLSPTQRFTFVKSLALATRKMNEGGFVNGEYHWRNILVTEREENYQFHIIDCCKSRLRDQYYPYLDVASLDVYATEFFTEEERLFFFKTYLQIEKLTSEHHKLLEHIAALKRKISRKELRRYLLARKKFALKKQAQLGENTP